MPSVFKLGTFKKSIGKTMSNNSSKPTINTLKHQRSRILGRRSDASLGSKFTTPQTDDSTVENQQPPESQEDLQSRKSQARSSPKPQITASESWSIWPRKSLDDSRIPNSSNKLENQQCETETETETETATQSQSQSQPQETPPTTTTKTNEESTRDDASIQSTPASVKRERESSWISWRKPSFTSLKRASETYQSNQPIVNDEEDELNSKESIKAIAHETNVPNTSSSWSFWNNTVTTSGDSKNLSNVLLNGGDALLFEPTEIKEEDNLTNQTINQNQNKKQKPNKSNKPKIPNKVLPEFEKSLPLYTTSTSIINNYNRLKYTLGFNVENPKHLYRTQTLPSEIKKVVVIGVHGFFPTKVLRPLIGEPTGTSIKFANEAEKAILRWAKKEQLNIKLQKIALEKEGKVFDRVEFFYKVIKKWEKDIQDSDFIYIAAHSQGCPVSIILLARLIKDGILKIDPSKRICILAMAGINNGPFYGVDQKLFVRAYSTIENDSLMELFQFQNFESIHSKEFLESLKIVIKNNVKISFIGSINDQLVPLYSSTCLHIRHPNIFRSTYIDGGSNTPDFVSRAVSMANHLHNIGLSDHGLIKEISNSLAGPLTGGGHSKIYNDPQVYDTALNFSLYTNDLKYDIPLYFKPYSIEQLGVNPYHLPWCMRGLLFEVRARLPREIADEDINKLFEEFEKWNPETKQLKDMKYRLNGIKSKL